MRARIEAKPKPARNDNAPHPLDSLVCFAFNAHFLLVAGLLQQ